MDYIDAIFFINLDHRTDRLQQIEDEMKKIGFPYQKIHRVSGIYKPEIGALGCGLSHIKVMDIILESNYSTCLVFEDDFSFTLDINYCKFLLRNFFESKREFDFVMLGGKIMKHESTDSSFLHKILDAQTSSAYIIQKSYARVIRDTLQEGMKLLEDWYNIHKKPNHDYCLDIYWKQLQVVDKWFVFHPKMGIQRESYSDIERRMTDYGV
jgi:hypothetical protein